MNKFTDEDDELLGALGVSVEEKKKAGRTPREARIIAGFEEVMKFVEEHGRAPAHGEGKDIFERLYAVRLDRMRELAECREMLAGLDAHGLLGGDVTGLSDDADEFDDEELLAELGVEGPTEGDVTKLKHVKPRAEIKAAEEIARRAPCQDFNKFAARFDQVRQELDNGARETRRFEKDAKIRQGEFFIVNGQLAYVAEYGNEFKADYGERDSRLRVIFDNETESNLLMRSLQKALYSDDAGRRITNPAAGPLFGATAGGDDAESGTIYVLRSKSDHEVIAANRDIIHKIGVTGGKVETRIANASVEATYLLADVEIVATYNLYNINRSRMENLLHRFFGPARLELEIEDRFGQLVRPREWFLVPLYVIDKVVEKIRDQTILDYEYDLENASLKKRN
jgi:Meiotically up-regulated gene 113